MRFFYSAKEHVFRSYELPQQKNTVLTALEVHDRFGGSIIEEVLEKGSERTTTEQL